MPILVQNLTLHLDDEESRLRDLAAAKLKLPPSMITHLHVVHRATDARNRSVRFIYTAQVALSESSAEAEAIARRLAAPVEEIAPPSIVPGAEEIRGRAVVVGCGPAGLFAALLLARHGYRPLLLERGASAEERRADISQFLNTRTLNPNSNVLFGAGGAGTYSDGKLYTRTHDARARSVLETLVAAGAPKEIMTDARPHVGTDLLHVAVANLCRELTSLGGEIHWRERMLNLQTEKGKLVSIRTGNGAIETNCLLLAAGANARDTVESLQPCGVALEAKPFQMGLRIEHPRELIDQAVFGRFAGHPKLGAAEYVLSSGGVAAFCVCPGGSLVASCAEEAALCTNGMSLHARDGRFTNAALVAAVPAGEPGSGALAGMEYQRLWERKAFQIAGADYAAPAQNASAFLSGKVQELLRNTTFPLGVRSEDLGKIIPAGICSALKKALPAFDRRIPGFIGQGVLAGPEARVTSAVRITRHPDARVSASVDGVYPAGEGSGYSSGIMSSAVDGIRSAEAIISRFAPARL